MPDRVSLKVNGDDVELNAFVRKALAGVIQGFLGALHRVPSPIATIEIAIERAPARTGKKTP